jgi:hypothetical protein
MKTFKQIAYAFATSTNAKTLGFNAEGCWFVEVYGIIEGVQMPPAIAHNCEGFKTPDDPDLIALYHEYSGDIAPAFEQFGNAEALQAISDCQQQET